MRHIALLVLVLGLSACAQGRGGFLSDLLRPGDARPAPRTAAVEGVPILPPEDARTVEEFDTTTPEARAAAVAETAPGAGDGRLGTTIGSLGAADEPGFWIKTPLVAAEQPGRVHYPVTGRTVAVRLIPSGGPQGGGSQVSLAAMRLLDAPLTGLPELIVYAN